MAAWPQTELAGKVVTWGKVNAPAWYGTRRRHSGGGMARAVRARLEQVHDRGSGGAVGHGQVGHLPAVEQPGRARRRHAHAGPSRGRGAFPLGWVAPYRLAGVSTGDVGISCHRFGDAARGVICEANHEGQPSIFDDPAIVFTVSAMVDQAVARGELRRPPHQGLRHIIERCVGRQP